MAFDDLYQEIILDHSRNPRNRANLDHIPESEVHDNPSCGDHLKLELLAGPDGNVESLRFDGDGCAISVASASMMTELLKGMPLAEARTKAEEFIGLMKDREHGKETLEADWGELAALGGVVAYPMRVKCATLAWHAVEDSIDKTRGQS